MPYSKQKQPTERILHITKRLYALEKLQSIFLAGEYDVSHRTIHRDMQKIAKTIALINDKGIWYLNIAHTFHTHNHFHQVLLGSFAHNLDIDMECLEKANISKENVAYAMEYKHLPKKLGEQILLCIQSEEQCTFNYVKDNSTTQRQVDPIKIYTENARWYVIAKDYKDDKVKYFNLTKIKEFKPLKNSILLITFVKTLILPL